MKNIAILYFLTVLWLLSSCAYLENVSRQNDLIQSQETNPQQHNLKHIIERDTYIVYGRLLKDTLKDSQHSLAVAALSDRFRQNEIVVVNHLGKVNSYYGLNLKGGKYQLLMLEDKNHDNRYRQNEIITEYNLTLNGQDYPDRVARAV